MALKIKKTSENGIVTTYHKIASISILYHEDGRARVTVSVHHYANSDYRAKNNGLNADTTTEILALSEEKINGNLREAIYQALKEKDEYKGAEDV